MIVRDLVFAKLSELLLPTVLWPGLNLRPSDQKAGVLHLCHGFSAKVLYMYLYPDKPKKGVASRSRLYGIFFNRRDISGAIKIIYVPISIKRPAMAASHIPTELRVLKNGQSGIKLPFLRLSQK